MEVVICFTIPSYLVIVFGESPSSGTFHRQPRFEIGLERDLVRLYERVIVQRLQDRRESLVSFLLGASERFNDPLTDGLRRIGLAWDVISLRRE